jgi:hypothetical protein
MCDDKSLMIPTPRDPFALGDLTQGKPPPLCIADADVNCPVLSSSTTGGIRPMKIGRTSRGPTPSTQFSPPFTTSKHDLQDHVIAHGTAAGAKHVIGLS